MQIPSEIPVIIESQLDSFQTMLDSYLKRIKEIEPRELWGKVYSICKSGKHLRPILIKSLFDINNYNIEIPKGLVSDTAALELVHSSTLIHDDIIDESQFRRRQKTINYLYNDSVALLVGNIVKDTALSIASNEALPIINIASRDVNLGQLWETMARDRKDLSILDYFTISFYKAAKIFRYCVNITSIYTKEPFDENVAQACELIAIAYQAADDWFDLHQNATKYMGKSSGLDEKNKVHSFMYADWNNMIIENTIFYRTVFHDDPVLVEIFKIIETIKEKGEINSRFADLNPTKSKDNMIKFCDSLHIACKNILSQGRNSAVLTIIDKYMSDIKNSIGQLI